MFIKHININNFRNYGRLELDVGPSVNVIYGDNAQGKTNLIEAINVCSCISSNRTSKDKELIKINENEYDISMLCHDEVYDSEFTLKTKYFCDNNSSKRYMEYDGEVIRKISNYIGVCNTVIFAPEDLNLVKGAPSSRRKFFNMLICKISSKYVDILNRTTKILNQKNACLKSFKGNTSNIDNMALDFWDFSLAELSAELIMYRYRYACLLSEKAYNHHFLISDGKEFISVSYCTISGSVELIEAFLKDNDSRILFIEGKLSEAIYGDLKAKLTDFILKKLKSVRINDVEKGISSTGVQRDDLDIKLDGLSMRLYSSQGQQRSGSLSLKLAELDIIRNEVSSTPILLLDDVFSELDIKRRTNLLNSMRNAQIFITCTDRSFVENELSQTLLKDIEPTYFYVSKGVVTKA